MSSEKLEQINSIEKKYGIKITKSHREFLFKINDNLLNLENKYFNIIYGSDKYIKIFKLYSLKKIEEVLKYFFESKEKETLEDFELVFFEKKMYVIGETYEGFDLCISYSEDNLGKVFFTDMIHHDESIFISNDFDDFINNLKKEP